MRFSLVGWWRSVDRYSVVAIAIIAAFGAVMVMAASPAIAERIGLEPFHFVKRHFIYLTGACFIMVIVSALPVVFIRRMAVLGVALCVVLMMAVLFVGAETKGAKRWIDIMGFTLQPSEFLKPCFAVLVGWLLARRYANPEFPGFTLCFALQGLVVLLLVLQPDIGMTMAITAVWGAQLFIGGFPLWAIGGLAMTTIGGLVVAYMTLPHVARRINTFLDPSSGDNFQVNKSLEAFMNGGFFGQGPGEGRVKHIIPDAHTDFIFAVAGEELGSIAAIILVLLFAFVVVRGFYLLLREQDIFLIYAASGILVQFGFQAVVNMGVSLSLLPNKGMTLPFVSYGGSSMLAIALGMGMLLAFTRKKLRTPHGGVMHAHGVM